MTPIASARMYAWSPSLTAAWHRLLEWVSVRAGVPLDVLDQADPLPLDDIWRRDDLGCVFMCGYPWALRRDRPHLLASPVPSPARYGGRPVYFTDFIVRDNSPYTRLEDTFGGGLAYSSEHSHSGYNAARYHLLRYRTPERPALYGRVLGPLGRQVPVIDAVIEGRADVGPVDGYALDLLRRHGAERARRVRVVATTVAAPSAPLVASPAVDQAARERLTETLLAAHQAPELAVTLDELLLARFVRVAPADLEIFLDRARAAEAAGYPKLT
jgi:ABC-type phosphate/phosphonate transport system substrate-binding protein